MLPFFSNSSSLASMSPFSFSLYLSLSLCLSFFFFLIPFKPIANRFGPSHSVCYYYPVVENWTHHFHPVVLSSSPQSHILETQPRPLTTRVN
jgi:hypothetical protein